MKLTSKYKGITNVNSVTKVDKPWRAEINPHGGYVRQLGSFRTEEEAVDAYNEAAINLGAETHFFTRVEYV
tara:strand:+ start:2842 stop:3054 length:213 start_codon:yes stop_codon:yes gene_type:complete